MPDGRGDGHKLVRLSEAPAYVRGILTETVYALALAAFAFLLAVIAMAVF